MSIKIYLDNSANSCQHNPPGFSCWVGGEHQGDPKCIKVDKTSTHQEYIINDDVTTLQTWYYNWGWWSGPNLNGPFKTEQVISIPAGSEETCCFSLKKPLVNNFVHDNSKKNVEKHPISLGSIKEEEPAKDTVGKQFIIKLKICNRLNKEINHYRNDALKWEGKIVEEKSLGCDPFDVKQMENVLQETYIMIPNSESRFKNALNELFTFLQECITEHEVVADTENLANAKSLLAENGLIFDEERNSNKTKED